ncbi:MAG: helix-turn-helix domain-containing protein [Tannerellaceae bacterium]|nr:helix-turn-helix domain-containing protein [Tannerellaceae bacterium]
MSQPEQSFRYNFGSVTQFVFTLSMMVLNNLLFVTILSILFLSLLLSGILFYLYRKQQQRSRELFLRFKMQEAAGVKQEETEPTDNPVLSSEIRQHELFVRLHDYLLTDRNYTKSDIDTSVLVAALSTNRSYLFEAVKLATGKTLQEYINHLRLKEATHLLETTDEVIESIAIICGYSSVRTFYRLFRSHYNMSPAAYRKMAREHVIT